MNRSNNLSQRLALLATLCALAVSTQVSALPDDRSQPIKVQAQKLEANRGKNLSIYSGKVVITQGSLQIRADRVEVHGSPSGEIKRVVAVGKPAHFQQQVQQSENPVKANALRIEFTVSSDKLHLSGDAHVDRDGNTLTAERIDYDMNTEQMQAEGQSNDGRVEMIWKPEKKATGDQSAGGEKTKEPQQQQ
ncbi:lipopolysaccharide transport periplasmic protein LptA [Microbulbifer sp. SAOS-129_SWC]|uniref:lipopolysaccharide transport periplasmic protein LptA n=1 Tax=Microbulbifer sp. SAOS-129_SWC TaxID=3145235 RepID=UPI0032162B30